LGAVGREAAVAAVFVEEDLLARSLAGGDEEETVGAAPVMVAAAGDEQPLAVGGPALHGVTAGVIREPFRGAAFGGDDVHLGRRLAVADECDLLAVGGELRLAVAGRVGGQLLGESAGGGHAPDVAGPIEDDRRPVRRQARMVGQADRLFGGGGGG